jgi:hypothetical protein
MANVAATLIFEERNSYTLKDGRSISVFMDLWSIDPPEPSLLEGRFKLSWIAFDESEPGKRVLMDCHKPLGLHFHIDTGPQVPVTAATLEEAYAFFRSKLTEYFGEQLEV